MFTIAVETNIRIDCVLIQLKNLSPLLSERLTETLRMNPSAAVSAQIFLMFRVLLLRISSQHLTSLWPIMVTELVSSHLVRTWLCTQGKYSTRLSFKYLRENFYCLFFFQIRIFARLEKTLQADKDISK